MPGQPVSAGDSFAAGLRSEALLTYKRTYEGVRSRLAMAMAVDYASTRRTEDYFFWESAPNMVRWVRGESMSEKSFKGVKYSCTNHQWARAISWMREDLEDDQTSSLLDQARDLGRSAALLDERVAFQMLLGSTDLDLLPSVPNAPDGSALFIGTSRFGFTNGNQVTGGGVATSAVIQTDYFKAKVALGSFQDTEGQPLFDESIVQGPKLVIYGIGGSAGTNEEFFKKAVTQNLNQGSSAAPSNILIDSGDVPTLWPTQRITDNDWFVVAGSSPLKALFSQLRIPLSEVIATKENSDLARQTGEESIRFQQRKGYGIHTPYAAVKVNN